MSSPKTPQLPTTTETFSWRPSAPSQRFSSGETRMTALCLSKYESPALFVLKTLVVRNVQNWLLCGTFVFSLFFLKKASFDDSAVSLCKMIFLLHCCCRKAAEAPSSPHQCTNIKLRSEKGINDNTMFYPSCESGTRKYDCITCASSCTNNLSHNLLTDFLIWLRFV